jgi:hypothetical protein
VGPQGSTNNHHMPVAIPLQRVANEACKTRE